MAHLTIAASEKTFRTLFEQLRDNFHFSKSDSGDFGPFTASYSVAGHLEGGTVDLRADNTVQLKELDLVWDTLDLTLGIDIPRICVGGFCIIPNPFGGCILRAPRICAFDSDPDISVTLPLGGLVSEVSFTGSLKPVHFTNPARPAGMNAWDAQDANPSLADRWQIFLDPQQVDLDPIDVSDSVGNLLEHLVDEAIDNLLGWLPGWARDLIRAILGSVIDVIRAILDIPDDIQEWISDLLNVSFGLLDFILQMVLEYFASQKPLQEIEDPFPMLPAVNNPNPAPPSQLVPVKIPIANLNIFCNDQEMVLEADIG